MITTLLLTALLFILPNGRAAACDIDRPIRFAGLDYDSAAFHTAVAQTILRHGFGCQVDRVPGATAALVNGLARGDVDVIMEIWLANPVEAWRRAEAAGRVVALGTTFPDATEGWFVPRYLVEGPQARAPGLRSVQDLKQHKALFSDPEEPAKGRFYNCVIGWVCEGVNSRKLIAYGLADDFTNIRVGSGEGMVAAIEAALKRQRPVVFYYWGPTWLLGAYDLVQLAEPPFDPAIWAEMNATERPTRATAYPTSRVVVGANIDFTRQAPRIAAFLSAYSSTSAQTSAMVAAARAAGISPEAQATRFLKQNPELWRGFVPPEIAARVLAAL
jgi:glycine betaine/proline transport system substrate-binding protein